MLYVDSEIAHRDENILPYPTVRHRNYELLVSSAQKRCNACTTYRTTLRSLVCKAKKSSGSAARVHPSSHTNYRFLIGEEKDERMHFLHDKVRVAEKRVQRLKKRLEERCERDGCSLDDETDQDIREIMKENTRMIEGKYPDGSFARIFWQQQLEASSKADARQMRWHHAMIRLVIEGTVKKVWMQLIQVVHLPEAPFQWGI